MNVLSGGKASSELKAAIKLEGKQDLLQYVYIVAEAGQEERREGEERDAVDPQGLNPVAPPSWGGTSYM